MLPERLTRAENGTVATALLSDLVERGQDPEQGILFVLDGVKALRKAADRRAESEAARSLASDGASGWSAGARAPPVRAAPAGAGVAAARTLPSWSGSPRDRTAPPRQEAASADTRASQ